MRTALAHLGALLRRRLPLRFSDAFHDLASQEVNSLGNSSRFIPYASDICVHSWASDARSTAWSGCSTSPAFNTSSSTGARRRNLIKVVASNFIGSLAKRWRAG